jgi:membrane peptidoglycan carboxypeptidase
MATRTRPAARSSTRARPKAARRRSFLWRWRRILFVSGLLLVALLAGAAFVLSNVPLPEEDPLRQTTFVCAADVTSGCNSENALAAMSAEEDRVNVRLEDVPEVLVQAVLAAEDKDFFDHGGIDPIGIGRALWNDIRNRSARQGGSTITQQYVKNA